MKGDKIHTTKFLGIYTDARESGCVDVAHIKLEGVTLVDDKDLAKLRQAHACLDPEPIPQHIVEVLGLCVRALTGPRGSKPKSQKARNALEAVHELLVAAPKGDL